MHIQVVNFNLKGISDAEFRRACDEQFAPAFASMPGMIYKVWLANAETNTYGAVYAWRDRKAMEEFMKSELFNVVANHPNFANITSKDFGVLEGPTRVTGGLVEARA
ncbi:MAG: YdhR family protein [Chloroflexi bacterium]|nr:YdhR family protein [Chloroflexota bacterium]